MQLQMTLSQADLIAALQVWVASPSGGSAGLPGGQTHEMNASVAPSVAQNGQVTISLNF